MIDHSILSVDVDDDGLTGFGIEHGNLSQLVLIGIELTDYSLVVATTRDLIHALLDVIDVTLAARSKASSDNGM